MPARSPFLYEQALDDAMSYLTARAVPWTARSIDLAELKKVFRTDFRNEIKNLDDYNYWRPRIERLFSHVGAQSAFLAESRLNDVGTTAGQVTWDDLIKACQLVKVLICPSNGPPGPKKLGRICGNVRMFGQVQLNAMRQTVTYRRLCDPIVPPKPTRPPAKHPRRPGR